MGIFDRFKKKEEEYDVTNLSVKDLNKNFIFDYNLSSWKVIDVFEYDWGDEFFTKEFKITDGDKTLFLHVEDDDELELTLSSKIKIRKIGEDIVDYIKQNKEPQKKLIYENEEYILDEESPGYIRNMNTPDSWVELISWDYYNNEGNKTICIEQFDDNKFDASVGIIINDYEISNITPSK